MNKKTTTVNLLCGSGENKKPQAARLRLNGHAKNYMHPSKGGALNRIVRATDFSDMLYGLLSK